MSWPKQFKSRINEDVFKLILSKYEVTRLKSHNKFHVKFYGPLCTPYENGVWKVWVHLPRSYPLQPPTIGFLNKIFHPNINKKSGKITFKNIGTEWSPSMDLGTIFESLLPQLLKCPELENIVNKDATKLFLNDIESYRNTVKEYVRKYATKDALRESQMRVKKYPSDDSLSKLSLQTKVSSEPDHEISTDVTDLANMTI